MDYDGFRHCKVLYSLYWNAPERPARVLVAHASQNHPWFYPPLVSFALDQSIVDE